MPIQKKKQSRLSILGQKLKTPKGRLVATMLTFAIIGGGIFVYRSFAATPFVANWAYGKEFYPINLAQNNPCATKDNEDRDAFGNRIQITTLSCPTVTHSTASSTAAYLWAKNANVVADRNAVNTINKPYRTCVDARGTGRIKVSISIGADKRESQFDIKSPSYGNFWCSSTLTPWQAGPVTVMVSAGHGKASLVNVRNVQLQRVN